MELKQENSIKEFIKEIEYFLNSRKNLMIYEDYVDDSFMNAYRFFYSSPKDFLEFICLDIYTKGERDTPLGIMSILTSSKHNIKSNLISIYGEVISEKILVRSTEKTKISLILNIRGYENIKEAIKYFESELI